MEADIEVAEISDGPITCEGGVIRCGGKLLYVLNEGETWVKVVGTGGVIVTHTDGEASWVKIEGNAVVATDVTASQRESEA